MSSLVGYTICPPSQLRQVLGDPVPGEGVVAWSWQLRSAENFHVEIYEYKSTSKYDKDLPAADDFLQAVQDYAWHVGSNDKCSIGYITETLATYGLAYIPCTLLDPMMAPACGMEAAKDPSGSRQGPLWKPPRAPGKALGWVLNRF